MRFLLLAGLALTTGCATKYAPLSGRGGYIELPQGPDTYDVSFSGNGMVPPDLLESYLLYRCAEVTEATGARYFEIQARGTEPKTGEAILPQYVYATIKVSEKEPRGRGEWFEAGVLMKQLEPYVMGD